MEDMKDTITGLIGCMQRTNDEIKKYSLQEQEAIEELSLLNQQMDKKELQYGEMVRGEFDSNGKPKHKNEEERNIAKNKLLMQDVDYVAWVDKKKDAGRKMGTARIEREYLLRQFSMWGMILGGRL